MKTAAFVLLFVPLVAVAGQAEYDRDAAKAKLDHAYVIKLCKKKVAKEAEQCRKEANRNLADALKGLHEYHLGKGKP